MSEQYATLPCFKVTQGEQFFYASKIKAKELLEISYVSARGIDSEPGAVQRVLNGRRISAIKDFVLQHGAFPSSIVLNWVKNNDSFSYDEDNSTITYLVEGRSAQLIDGQHRLAGIQAAIEEDDSVGELELTISIYENLATHECANIFLAINTEQKPVSKSLVYDLYAIADESIIDNAAARARDIVDYLYTDRESPYYQQIKIPGSPRRKGGVALSTAVSSIKPLVEFKGTFEQHNINGIEIQKEIIKNFFVVVSEAYGVEWLNANNAFIYSSGFTGAIEFLEKRVVPNCASNGMDFSQDFMRSVINLEESGLILQEEVKGLQGKQGPRVIFDLLVSSFTPRTITTDIKY